MQIVIDIDDKLYKRIKYLEPRADTILDELMRSVQNGTPLDKIKAEIEQVKFIMNEEIINHDRKDLINFVHGLNQSLAIIARYKAESEDKE